MCSSSITVSIGLAGEDLGRVLVDQVVATLDGVEHVPLPVVLLLVAQGGTHAALRGAGVGAGRVELGQDRGVDAGLGQLERRPQARAAGADDEGVVVADHVLSPGNGSVTTTIVPRAKSTIAPRYRSIVSRSATPPLV